MMCREEKDKLHFGIKGRTWNKKKGKWNDDGAPLRVEHLHSLFLYTDFSALSTAFSSSFRAVYRGESLDSIKARNGRFHHFAKHLKELVMYFGDNGIPKKWAGQESRGPFYCG